MEETTCINWQNILEGEFAKDYFKSLNEFLDDEYANYKINPERRNIFEALELTPFEKVKVVIVGQDPYPGRNQAHGLAFSIPLGTKIPLALENIYKLLQSDLGHAPAAHGCLKRWATQGVLLLNSILTVRQEKIRSHANKGWETFTDAIIDKLNEREEPVVFILWGEIAQSKSRLITNETHLILTNLHPNDVDDENLTYFLESKPFSKANEWLDNYNLEPIYWKLPYINNDWQKILEDEFSKEYFRQLQMFLDEEYKNYEINPEKSRILEALELTPFEKVKVVIVGQDPYPGRNQAHGLAFSIPLGTKIPLALENIYKLLQSDLGHAPAAHGCLKSWATQGVLLLNSILTVRQKKIRSHANKGWETFTDAIIEKLNEREEPVVFILWGEVAQSKSRLITNETHLILTNLHPNDVDDENLTYFLESKPFSKANVWLDNYNLEPIYWKLPYINNDWQKILEDEFSKEYFRQLQMFLDEEYENYEINPERSRIFEALELTPFEKVKVVIVGQDPCPGKTQAFGVAFSVPFGTEIPPSVNSIYKELKNDLGHAPVKHGCLESWAKQGVLLLNTILTLRQGKVRSHEDVGWETFTDAIIRKLNERETPVVFILWGGFAKQKKKFITSENHLILTAPHPAAVFYDEYNIDFFGSKPFSKANKWLKKYNIEPIDWKLPQGEEEDMDEVDNIVHTFKAIGV